MAKPRLIKRADGKILMLGDGSDYAVAMISVTPQVLVQTPPTVSPLVTAAKLAVKS
jgi:hypothetical protein